MAPDLSAVCLRPEQTLRDAMLCVDRNTKGIALVVDHQNQLLHTITDGDLRRAVLLGFGLDMTIERWAGEVATPERSGAMA